MTDHTAPEAAPPPPPATLAAIFLLFLQIGCLSFGGGVLGWLFREVVEKRRWLTDTDFLGGLTLAQVAPGINVTNMSVYVGQRLRGAPGAVTAVIAVFTGPFLFVIGLFLVYAEVKGISWAPHLLSGVAFAAVGLFLSVGIKSMRKNIRDIGQWAILVGVFVAVGILRWPLIWVVLVLAPVSIWLSWLALAREEKAKSDA